MVGQQISHYKVLDKLGEGGMGVVYRAIDTKLDREVALKFLPNHLLGDEEVRKRFGREAKASAALSHANVCTVYEIDEADGNTFIAMELVEGEPLDERIAHGPLGLEDALDIAQQIAQGLEAAHEKGVFHRDIKPENVIVDSRGHATIMDFGLAQLAESSRLTKADQTMGTVFYMSPEQTEGSGTDQRTDIWSLGVVIYEMVTGQHPFKGDYGKAVMYSILNEEPEPITGVRTGVPMELEVLVGKCLRKDAAKRYGSAAEVVVDLESIRQLLTTRLSAVQSKIPELGPSPTRSQLPWVIAVVSLAMATALAVTLLMRSDPAPQSPIVATIEAPPGVASVDHPEFSPDGEWILFVGRSELAESQLYLRRLDRLTARELEGSRSATYPFWAPDSRRIGFFAEGKLKTIDIVSGRVSTLADAPNPRGGTWGGKGVIVFAPQFNAPLQRVSIGGGSTQPATQFGESRNEARSHRFPVFLPDGDRFVFFAFPFDRSSAAELVLGSLGSAETKVVMPSSSAAIYQDGYLLIGSEGDVSALPFDPVGAALLGEAQRLGLNVANTGGLLNIKPLFSASAGNRAAFIGGSAAAGDSRLAWRDRSGGVIELVGERDRFVAVELSPDERTAAAAISSGDDSNEDLWLISLQRKLSTRFTFDPARDISPLFSASGDELFFASNRDGPYHVYAKRIAEVRAPRLVFEAPDAIALPRSISSNGTLILGLNQQIVGAEHYELRSWSVTDERNRPQQAEPLLVTEFGARDGRLSPDNLWLAYVSNESGRDEVFIARFPDQTGRVQVSDGGAEFPLWRGDGKELFYVAEGGMIAAVEVNVSGDSIHLGNPETLFQVSFPRGTTQQRKYAVSSDGEKFLVIQTTDPGESRSITILSDWKSRLAPQ